MELLIVYFSPAFLLGSDFILRSLKLRYDVGLCDTVAACARNGDV
jgi:hypothetical protein